MESREIGGKSLKTVCRICGYNVGNTENGELFIACDVCSFRVCRPCYEYERKDGNQSCPQCKTRYKRQKGSPTVFGDKEEDVDVDDNTAHFPLTESQTDKQKIAQRMLSWYMTYGRETNWAEDTVTRFNSS